MKSAEVSTPSDREVLVKRSFNAPVNLVWQTVMVLLNRLELLEESQQCRFHGESGVIGSAV